MNGGGTETLANFGNNGAVELYHDNSAKLATTSSGVDVTGTLDASSQVLVGTNNSIFAENNIRFKPSGGAFIDHNTTGQNINFRLSNSSSLDVTPLVISPTAITTAVNVDVTGTVVADGLTVDGTATITYTGTGDGLVLESTETGASGAPDLVLYRNSSSPADSDDIGNILFRGKDDAGNDTSYAFILGEINDASNGSEDGNLFFRTQSAGSLDNRLSIVSDKVGIGTTSPLGKLSIQEGSSGGSANSNADGLVIDNTGKTGITILTPNDSEGLIFFADPDDDNIGRITYNHSTNAMGFVTNNSTALTIDSSSNVGIGTTSPSANLHVSTSSGDCTVLIEAAENASGSEPRLQLKGTNTSSNPIIEFGDSAAFPGSIEYENSDNSMRLTTNASEALRIDSSGNLGLGTTSPNGKLTISNSGAGGFEFTPDTTAFSVANSNYIASYDRSASAYRDIVFDLGGAENQSIRFKAGGNVGIGTSSPAEMLHVTGDIRVDTDLILQPTKILYLDGGNDTYINEVAANTIGFNTAGGERVRIDASGNVGIGAGIVGALLTVNNGNDALPTIAASTKAIFACDNTANFDTSISILSASSGGESIINFGDYANEDAGQIKYENDNGGSDYMAISVNTSEALRILHNGDVGIGTTSPSHNLHVFADSGTTQGITSQVNNGNAANFQFEKARGGSGGPSVVQSGDDLGNLVFAGYDGNSYASAATIKGEVDGTPGDGDMPGRLSFRTSADGSESPSERMRIDSSGRLLIGTTSTTPAFGTGNGHAFHVGDGSHLSRSGGTVLIVNRGSDNGDIIDCRKDGTKVGSISVNDTATTYNTTSDARLKDVTGSARGLEVINELNPVAYNWKSNGKADEGLIAQEVLDVVPNAVSGSEEDMYQMDYSKLVVHLVAGMKEQQEQIEALQSEINELKNS
jgi:hypothetical protein